MKVCLIFPNYILRDEFGDPTDPPLGIASIAAVLERARYIVSVIDANAENLALPEIRTRLTRIDPDIVCISCNYSPLHNPTLKLAEMVKNEFGVPVVVGGNHATALAEYILECSNNIDFIVRGEGEKILPNLINALSNNTDISVINGITYRYNGCILNTDAESLIHDLNKLPLPAYHLLPMDKYSRFNIISSRGCPFNCSYCASKVVFGRRVRFRSPKIVLDEIEFLVHHYGQKHFWFSDDTFISNIRYTDSLMDELKNRNLGITWSCVTRVDIFTESILNKMKDAGCIYISYGIESGNQAILNKIGKDITIHEIQSTLEITSQVGIRRYGFFIVGFPGDTWNTIMDSYKLIFQSKLDGAAFNILIPLPGTPMMNDMIEQNMINLDEIKWDYLVARTANETYVPYAAQLAAKWTSLSPVELVEACQIGHRFPSISAHIHRD